MHACVCVHTHAHVNVCMRLCESISVVVSDTLNTTSTEDVDD